VRQHLGVPQHARLPVLVNVAAQVGLCVGDLAMQMVEDFRVEGGAAVALEKEGVVWELVEMGGKSD